MFFLLTYLYTTSLTGRLSAPKNIKYDILITLLGVHPVADAKNDTIYKIVLYHSPYLCLMIACWAMSRMTSEHLLFVAGMSTHILISICFE